MEIQQIRPAARRLASIEVWVVVLLLAASLFSARLLPVAVVGSLLFWPVRWIAFGRLTSRTPADWGIILVLLAALAGWLLSFSPEATTPQTLRLISGMALYYAIVNWVASPGRARLVSLGFVLAGGLLALLAPFAVQWGAGGIPLLSSGLVTRIRLLVTDAINPNVMGAVQVIILPFAVTPLLFAWKNLPAGWKAALLAGSVLIAGIIGISQSRGAWLAVAAMLALLVILRWRRGWIVLLAAGIAGLMLFSQVGFSSVVDQLFTGGTVSGADERIEIWSRAIYILHDFPLTGIGMGNFGAVTDLLYPLFLARPGETPHAHNLFLQVGIDLGIPGLTGWLSIWLVVTLAAWQLFKSGRQANENWACALGAGFLGSQVALAVHGLVDAALWGMIKPAPVVWAVWGTAVAALSAYRRASGSDVKQHSGVQAALGDQSHEALEILSGQ